MGYKLHLSICFVLNPYNILTGFTVHYRLIFNIQNLVYSKSIFSTILHQQDLILHFGLFGSWPFTISVLCCIVEVIEPVWNLDAAPVLNTWCDAPSQPLFLWLCCKYTAVILLLLRFWHRRHLHISDFKLKSSPGCLSYWSTLHMAQNQLGLKSRCQYDNMFLWRDLVWIVTPKLDEFVQEWERINKMMGWLGRLLLSSHLLPVILCVAASAPKLKSFHCLLWLMLALAYC